MVQPRVHFAAFLLLASMISVSAQQSSTTALKVTTKLTVEDVTVTDSNGKPVHGLAQSDFTIKEDGKPQRTKDFNEYGQIVRALPPQKLLPNVFTNQQSPASTTSAVNIILLDEVTTGLADGLEMAPDNLMYAKQGSIRYLKTMPSGTQVAILLLSSGLHVVQGFTSDRDVLIAAINSVSYKPVEGTYHKVSIDRCPVANTQSQMQLDALNEVAAFVSSINGRKNLIWFTPGTPWLTNYPLFSHSRCLTNFTPELNRTYGALTAAHVALYPVDPRGVKVTVPTAEDNLAFNADGRPSSDFDLAGVQAQTRLNFDHFSVGDMAAATGGTAYFARNDLDGALGDAIATGADYYSLSYIPPVSKYDGRYHKIDVKVDRPGLHLQYREGYTSSDPAKLPHPAENSKDNKVPQPESPLHAAMNHGLATSTQLTFGIRVTPAPAKPGDSTVLGLINPKLKNKPLVRYDIFCAMPSDQLTLAQDGPNGARTGSLQLVVIAYDGEGNKLNVLGQTAVFTLKPEKVAGFLQNPFQMSLKIDLPPGAIFLRAGILDPASGKIGTLEVPVTVAKE